MRTVAADIQVRAHAFRADALFKNTAEGNIFTGLRLRQHGMGKCGTMYFRAPRECAGGADRSKDIQYVFYAHGFPMTGRD